MTKSTLGDRIKTYRKSLGMTQQNLADKVGISRTYVQVIETGKRMGTIKMLNRIAEALHVCVADLVGNYPHTLRRVQLEGLLTSGEVDIWFGNKKLNDVDLRRVKSVIQSVVGDYD